MGPLHTRPDDGLPSVHDSFICRKLRYAKRGWRRKLLDYERRATSSPVELPVWQPLEPGEPRWERCIEWAPSPLSRSPFCPAWLVRLGIGQLIRLALRWDRALVQAGRAERIVVEVDPGDWHHSRVHCYFDEEHVADFIDGHYLITAELAGSGASRPSFCRHYGLALPDGWSERGFVFEQYPWPRTRRPRRLEDQVALPDDDEDDPPDEGRPFWLLGRLPQRDNEQSPPEVECHDPVRQLFAVAGRT